MKYEVGSRMPKGRLQRNDRLRLRIRRPIGVLWILNPDLVGRNIDDPTFLQDDDRLTHALVLGDSFGHCLLQRLKRHQGQILHAVWMGHGFLHDSVTLARLT